MTQLFFYPYSLTGNTYRFARKLSDELGGVLVTLSGPQKMRDPLSQRDQNQIDEYLAEFPDALHVVLTPSYPRNVGGDLVDATPQPVKGIYRLIQQHGLEHRAKTIVFGNRTFGEDFCAAAWESPLEVIGKVELAGTSMDLSEAIEQIVQSL